MESIDSEVSATSENVCQHNKYGFCKFREWCNFRHINEICQKSSCEVARCLLRHPKECRFHRDYRRCKFGKLCCYQHVQRRDLAAAVSDSHNLIECRNNLQLQIDELSTLISEKNHEIALLSKKLEEQELLGKLKLIHLKVS